MAQSANTANDADILTVTVDNKDAVETATDATLISPVYRRPKDDPSPAPSPVSKIKLSEAEIRGLIIECYSNIREDTLTEALENAVDGTDVFSVKQWCDENYSETAQIKAEWKKHQEKLANLDAHYDAVDAEQKADKEEAEAAEAADVESKEEAAEWVLTLNPPPKFFEKKPQI